MKWSCGEFEFDLSRRKFPLMMGILNITPDSFSDGGRFMSTNMSANAPANTQVQMDLIVQQAGQMILAGADMLDIGAESSRPNAEPVSEQEELARLIPVLEVIVPLAKRANVAVSVDTYKANVMREALRRGVSIINDISGFRSPDSLAVIKQSQCGLVVMHMQGTPKNMNEVAKYDNVCLEVWQMLSQRKHLLRASGIAQERIVLDPGIGFAKTTSHNVKLLRALSDSVKHHLVLVGVSRKRFLGEIAARDGEPEVPVSQRFAASIAAHLYAAGQGAHILRIHDVAQTLQSLRVLHELRTATRFGGSTEMKFELSKQR